MAKFVRVIDTERCMGCRSCLAACHMENHLTPDSPWNVMMEWEMGTYPNVGRSFVTMNCETALAETAQTAEIDAYPGITEHAKLIREGKIDLGRRYSMHPEQGRFHIVHVDEIDMECTSCHVAEGFAPDYQLLRKVQAEQKAAGIGKGAQADVIDRSVCLGCHKGGGIATRWYGTVAQ